MLDKALYQAPVGLSELEDETFDIEIIDSDSISDDLDIEIEEGFGANLAEGMDESELALIADDLLADFQSDIDSRKDWMQTYVDGIQLLGLKIEERTEPWPGACGVYHPILSEALVKFQSETIMETFPAQGPVKTQIIGKETLEKKEAAQRVQADMNFQLMENMPEYRPEHERMLWGLGMSGNAFKKVYFDPTLQRQVSVYVPAEDIVVPYGASSLLTSERVTHVMRKTKNELKKLQVGGFYLDEDLGEPAETFDDVEKKIAEKMGFRADSDDRYKLLEMHVNYDLPGYEDKEDGEETGIGLPYVITIEKNTQTVLSIRRNWNENDPLKQKRNHFVHYGYIPGFGFYCFGMIHLIGAFAKSGTSLLRQLVDAGTLANLPGGFKTKGLRIKGDDTPIAPAEFRDVDVSSGSIKDNIMTLPYKEPSQVLSGLLDKINDEGRRLGSIADMNVSDMSANAPVGTTLALLERQLKTMSAVQARVHFSMKQEFKLLKSIIRDYAPAAYEYDPASGTKMAKQEDYDMVDVIPVSDPNSSTMAQRIMQYQAVMQMAQQAPQIYNLPNLHRQMIEVLGIKNGEKLVPTPDDEQPRDPVSENMAFLKGEPTKAFIYQDQDAHIAAHTTFMKDPMIAAQMGQNPMAQQMMAAIQAHIAEHLAFSYRRKIEEQMGVPLPPPNEKLPEDVEVQLSKLVADASAQLLQMNMAQAQQQQAQQQAQDPLIQMQQQELQIKAEEVKRKAAKDQADMALAQARLQIDAERIKAESQREVMRLQSAQKNHEQKIKADVITKMTKV